MKIRKPAYALAAAAALTLAIAVLHSQGFSFLFLAPGYSQHLFGVTSPKSATLGGVAVLQGGDVLSAECRMNGTNLHRFIASSVLPPDSTGTSLHPETIVPTTGTIAGGCGIALNTDG